MKSVLQEWLLRLSMMQQTVALEMIRGCDGSGKNDPTKSIIRELRKVLLYDAGGEGSSFMVNPSLEKDVKSFFEDCDSYPLHFAMHLAHSAQIVGYKHPDKQIAQFWRDFYFDYCHTIHLNPESEEQLDARLCDGRDERKHGSEYRLITEWKAHGERTYTQTEVNQLLNDKESEVNYRISKATSATAAEVRATYRSGRTDS
jgi:hypothetical protein